MPIEGLAKYECDHCDYGFAYKNALKRHLLENHSTHQSSKKNNLKRKIGDNFDDDISDYSQDSNSESESNPESESESKSKSKSKSESKSESKSNPESDFISNPESKPDSKYDELECNLNDLDINALDIQSDDSSEVSIDDPEFFNDPETMKKKNKKNERDLRWKFSSKEIEKRDQEFLDEEKKIEKEQEYSSSKNKQQINLLIVEFIKKTLPLPKQHAMILDHTDLLTTKTFMKYNTQMRIDIINLETDNAVKIFHNLAELYPYKMHNLNNRLVFENLHVYSNRSYDDQLLQTCRTSYSPNIYFADYTNTSMNHLTASRKINQKNNFRNVFGRVLKCTTEKKLVFAFTFSQRNASTKINKLTLLFIKLANKNKFLVNDFKTLSYRKSKRNGLMSFYIFQLLRDIPNYIEQNQELLEEICKNSNYKSETWEHNKFD